MAYTYHDFGHLADLSAELDDLLANPDFDQQHEHDHETIGVSTLSQQILNFVLLVTAIIFFLLTCICCEGFTFAFFVCKAVALLLSAILDTALIYSLNRLSLIPDNDDIKFDDDYFSDSSPEALGSREVVLPKTYFMIGVVSIALLHFCQMLSVMFIFHIFTCTCKTEIVNKSMLSCFKDIGRIAGVTIVISAVDASAIAIFFFKVKNGLEWKTVPLYTVSTLLETVAIMYFAYFVLRSLDESRRFREQNRAKPDQKLRNLMILVVTVPILFLLRFVALASSSVVSFIEIFTEGDDSECWRQQLQKVVTELGTNIDMANIWITCSPSLSIKYILFYLTRYFNHAELLVLVFQQLYNKFMR